MTMAWTALHQVAVNQYRSRKNSLKHYLFLILLAALTHNSGAANISLLKTYNTNLGYSTGEVYIENRLIAHYVDYSNQSPFRLGSYNVKITFTDKYAILRDTISSDEIYIGDCDKANNKCLISAKFIDNTPYKIDNLPPPYNYKNSSKVSESFTYLKNVITNYKPSNSIYTVTIKDITSEGITYTRSFLETFNDKLFQEGGIWKLEEYVGGNIYSSRTLKESYRATRYIYFDVINNAEDSVTKIKLPINGGCERLQANGLWIDPTNNYPFIRSYPKTEPLNIVESCQKTPSVPNECRLSTAIGPQCTFYSTCLSSIKDCGASGYALGYGKKYCDSFSNSNFSENGSKWRNSTLICLQEELVNNVLFEDLSCTAIKDIAFNSHPNCYTRNGSGISICDFNKLTAADYYSIFKAIDIDDILSKDSAIQIVSTLKTCLKDRSPSSINDSNFPADKLNAIQKILDLEININ